MKKLKEKIACPVCGVELKQLGTHLSLKHGMTGKEARERFGLECLVAPAEQARMSENASSRRPEVRKKIARSKRGKHPSPETRRKMSQSHEGRPCSAETAKKISASQKGKPRPFIQGEKNGFYDKHHTEESLDKMIMNRDGKSRFKWTPPLCKAGCGRRVKTPGFEYCQRCAVRIKNSGENNPSKRPEVIQKLKALWEDLEFVKRMMKARHAKPNKAE